MKENPENVQYAMVGRRVSAWRQGAKAAAVVAVIQIILSVSHGDDISLALFSAALVFSGYWLLFSFIIWLWRVVTCRT